MSSKQLEELLREVEARADKANDPVEMIRVVGLIPRLVKALRLAVEQRDSYAAENATLECYETYDTSEEDAALTHILEGRDSEAERS